MNRLRQFLYGRYGIDPLSIALLILSAIAIFVISFTPVRWVSVAGYAPVVIVIIRAFSRNIEARRKENDVFLSIFRKVTGRGRAAAERVKDTTHKYYKCSGCGATMRVPINKGKVRIKCSKCSREFVKNTGKPVKEYGQKARPVRPEGPSFKTKMADKEHRYFKCPDCSAQLRVPKGRGKIIIKCSKCGKTFQKKT